MGPTAERRIASLMPPWKETDTAGSARIAESTGISRLWTWRRRPRVADSEDRLAAFEALLEECWEPLWKYAYHTTGNVHDAEDLLSEATMEGFRSFHQFRGETTMLRWMYRVMTTTRIDMIRRNKRHKAESISSGTWGDGEESFDVPDDRYNPESILLDSTLSEPVAKAFAALTEDQRQIVVLADIEQFEYEEISKVMRIPLGTVKSRLHRARTAFRNALRSEGWNG